MTVTGTGDITIDAGSDDTGTLTLDGHTKAILTSATAVDVVSVNTNITGSTKVTVGGGTVVITGKYAPTVNAVSTATACDLSIPTTSLANGTGSVIAPTIAAGVNGQIKNFVCITATSEVNLNFGGDNLQGADGTTYQYLVFNSVGQSAQVIYLNSKWHILGAGAKVTDTAAT